MIHMKHKVCNIPNMKMKRPIAMVIELFSMFLFKFFSKGSNAEEIQETSSLLWLVMQEFMSRTLPRNSIINHVGSILWLENVQIIYLLETNSLTVKSLTTFVLGNEFSILKAF